MSLLKRYTRSVERRLRGLLPATWRRAGKMALLRFINPRKELPSILGTYTSVVTLVARTANGLVVFDVRDHGVGWPIALQGGWEPEESDRLREIVGPGDMVIDVGANIGWYTLLLSGLVGERGLVVAFEPDPRNFELLTEMLRINKRADRVQAHMLALLSEDRTVEFELSDQNFGDHRVRMRSPGTSGGAEQYAEAGRKVTQVAARRLDAVLEESRLGNRPIKLLKMDCQGAEPAIVEGAPGALQRTAYVATEFWPYGIRRAGYDPDAYIRTLTKRFDSFAILHDGTGSSAFQPTAGLEAHARGVSDVANYLFRNSELARQMERAS